MSFIAESIDGRAAQQVLKRRVEEIESGEYVEPEAELQAHLIEKGWADSDDIEFQKDLAGGNDADLVYWDFTAVEKKRFSDGKRTELAKKGHALSDGSYPIENEQDLENAITLAKSGHGNAAAARSLCKRRAKDLNATDKLPEDWR